MGCSPDCQDVAFQIGLVKTRPGLQQQFSTGLTAQFDYLKTYITQTQVLRMLALDMNGNVYKENPINTLQNIATVAPGASSPTGLNYCRSCSAFDREYMAFSDGRFGYDMPRQYDDVNFDRVSQVGPGVPPTAADSGAGGNIAAGTHGVAVSFRTRQGFITTPSPAGAWSAAGGKQVSLTNIPIGPPNIVARIIMFTLAAGSAYYYFGGNFQGFTTFIINDNTTTTATLDFSDAVLATGTSADYLFRLVELEESAGSIDYASRVFWWGGRNRENANGGGGGFNNLSFDGGFLTDGSGRQAPLGWLEDLLNYAGGGDVLVNYPSIVPLWGNAYSITGDGSGNVRGKMSQSAYQDVNGVALIQPSTAYSVRVRARTNNLTNSGAFHIHLVSTSLVLDAGLDINGSALTANYQEFIGTLTTGITSPPADLHLVVSAQFQTNGIVFVLENIEIFPTNIPYLTSTVRGSRVENAESFDGVNGIIQFGEGDGYRVTSAFKLRNNLYFTKEHSLWQTADDGTNEPSKWVVNPISSIFGTPSIQGVGIGPDWVVIADRDGLYYYDGGEPEKISQEIQKPVVTNTGALLPGWDNINWQFGYTIWCQVDEKNKRIMVGAPVFGATTPNVVFVLDYRMCDTGRDIVQNKSVHISAYTGKLYCIASGRKWTRWNMSINSASQVERPDGTAHIFMGTGLNVGLILDLLDVEDFSNPAQFGDTTNVGVVGAINSYYDSYFFLRPQEEEQYQLGSHRKLYRYLTLYVEGQGILLVSARPQGDYSSIPLPQTGVALPQLSTTLSQFQLTIASISLTSNLVTLITTTPHNLSPTGAIVITNTGNSTLNGTFGNYTIINPTQIQFPLKSGNIATLNIGNVVALIQDIEIPTNILTERTKYRVNTNAIGSWFSMRTLTPSIMTDPWAPVRGTN